MQTIIVFTAKPVSEDELRAFTTEAGGAWNEDYGVHQGYIERDGGAILVYFDEGVRESSDEEELAHDKAILGSVPLSYIVIGVLRLDECRASIELAKNVAFQIAQRWRGAIDWDDVEG